MQLSVGKSLALFKLHFKLYKIKKVCFGIILYELISSNYIKLNFLVNSSKGMFHINIENSDKQTTERMSIYLLRPIPPNIRLDEDVLKTSFAFVFRRRLQDEYIRISNTSSEDVFKTSWSRPIYSSWLYVFKTSCKNFFKTSLKRLQDVLQKRLQDLLQRFLQDVFKTYH